MVFLAILYALRPDVVDLSKARTRSNKQNLAEAFRVAESELRIPKLLDPDGESTSSFTSMRTCFGLFRNTHFSHKVDPAPPIRTGTEAWVNTETGVTTREQQKQEVSQSPRA